VEEDISHALSGLTLEETVRVISGRMSDVLQGMACMEDRLGEIQQSLVGDDSDSESECMRDGEA
jgi:hypothetical protein